MGRPIISGREYETVEGEKCTFMGYDNNREVFELGKERFFGFFENDKGTLKVILYFRGILPE